MDCQSAMDQMAGWVDDQLSPGEQELFAEHIHRCSACRDHAEALATQPLHFPAPPPLPAAMWAHMDAALSAELDRTASAPPPLTPWHHRRLQVSAPALLLYAALLLLTVSWGAYTHQQLQASEETATILRAELSREKRLAAQPSNLPLQGYRLATSSPNRGTF